MMDFATSGIIGRPDLFITPTAPPSQNNSGELALGWGVRLAGHLSLGLLALIVAGIVVINWVAKEYMS